MHPTRTRHGHPAFLCYIDLFVTIESQDIILMFSHMNLLSPAIGDPISIPTQDMLMGLYVLTIGNRRGICANRYNPCNHLNYQNEKIDDNNYKYTKEKEPYFCSSYDALGAYRQKRRVMNGKIEKLEEERIFWLDAWN